MPKKTREPEDGQTRFADLVTGVRPLRTDRVHVRGPKPRPVPMQKRRDEALVMRELLSDDFDPEVAQPGDSLLYHRPGIQHRVIRQLRRGQYRIEAELDLHGLSAHAARAELSRFLHDVKRAGIRCVRIIHGKGNRSSNRGPVLKPRVNHWLRQRGEVLAFSSAVPADGGTGALYVLLKRR
ncbi:MAG: Smr/MutS family protein [Pseudomonadota bacterium]|nr:Smr/MutS family protein [Pseudomonadota bacterium]